MPEEKSTAGQTSDSGQTSSRRSSASYSSSRRSRRGGATRGDTRRRPRSSYAGAARPPRRRLVILFENPRAFKYSKSVVSAFCDRLIGSGFSVERISPPDASQMVTQASDARKRKPHAMIVAGGDGAVNLVARTLVGSPIRLAILPLGKCNNIFRSLIGPPAPDRAFEALISDSTRKIDCGKVSGQPFFGSIGLGMLPALVRSLDSRALPRFSFGWSRLANRADADIEKAPMGVKVDSYRFDLEPTIVNVNLLPYSFGLPLAPSASPDDQKFEVTLDIASEPGTLSKFVRSLLKRTQRYDGAYTLYRGDEVTIGSVKDRTLYLDGELIKVPTNTLEVRLYSKQLRICAPPVPA